MFANVVYDGCVLYDKISEFIVDQNWKHWHLMLCNLKIETLFKIKHKNWHIIVIYWKIPNIFSHACITIQKSVNLRHTTNFTLTYFVRCTGASWPRWFRGQQNLQRLFGPHKKRNFQVAIRDVAPAQRVDVKQSPIAVSIVGNVLWTVAEWCGGRTIRSRGSQHQHQKKTYDNYAICLRHDDPNELSSTERVSPGLYMEIRGHHITVVAVLKAFIKGAPHTHATTTRRCMCVAVCLIVFYMVGFKIRSKQQIVWFGFLFSFFSYLTLKFCEDN